MPATVTVIHKWAKIKNQGNDGIDVVDTTSKADSWQRDLSPFHLGPCPLYDGYTARRMENAWQYAKVYKKYTDAQGNPTEEYWEWAKQGWTNDEPQRYPMGKGSRPEYSLWQGEHLGYIDARKRIYGPLYAEAVQKTEGWQILKELYETGTELYLRDWDGWSMSKHGMNSLTEVLNNPSRIMGHAFVLAMLLTDDDALDQLELRLTE